MVDYMTYFEDFDLQVSLINDLEYQVFRALNGSIFYIRKLLRNKLIKGSI